MKLPVDVIQFVKTRTSHKDNRKSLPLMEKVQFYRCVYTYCTCVWFIGFMQYKGFYSANKDNSVNCYPMEEQNSFDVNDGKDKTW